MKATKNILIVGLGGQGINTLYQVLQSTILKAGLMSKGAIFKGGAQKRGAVKAMIRIFDGTDLQVDFSPIIPNGSLDVLIALEANEALRYSVLFKEDTRMLINNFSFPFYEDRLKKNVQNMPIDNLKKHFVSLVERDYNLLSTNLFRTIKMANILMILDAIALKFLPVEQEDILDALQQKLKLSYEDMMILLEHVED